MLSGTFDIVNTKKVALLLDAHFTALQCNGVSFMSGVSNSLGFKGVRGLCDCGSGSCRGSCGSTCAPATACPSAGSLLPVAYSTSLEEVMDLLVTREIAAGVALGFRFYPQNDGYMSFASSAVSFILNTSLAAGNFVRLLRGAAGGMVLQWRESGGAFATLGLASTLPNIGANYSCFIYWAPNFQTLSGVASIGLVDGGVDPIPPPPEALSCAYQIIADVPTGTNNYIYYNSAANRRAIPADWPKAWQVLKWGAGWTAAEDPGTAYDTTVYDAEEELYIAPEPGQLSAIAYRPYDSVGAPGFGGQWAWMATQPIPPGTLVYIKANDWVTGATVLDANWSWTSPSTAYLPAGTVIDITGLGTAVAASIGTAATIAVPAGDLTAFTAYTADTLPTTTPITATLPCAYRGLVPECLVPGLTILARPWPDCSSILALQTCRRVCDWQVELVRINSACPVRWIIQTLPSYVTCLKGCPQCCQDKLILPSTYPTTVPILGGCGCAR